MIQVDRLVKRYGKTVAVDAVSLRVKRGEVFALLGPNGSGKTTTMRSIVGLNVPTSGCVLVNGLDVQRFPKETRQLVSYLPQRVVFPETMTGSEIVRFYAKLRKVPQSEVAEGIKRADFNGFSDKRVGEFSGGMIQRLGLTIVSLANAPILLLDEPTANLDPEGVKRFREFVVEQRVAGKTILFSTHLLAEAEQLADRVAIFVSGRLVALESVEALRETHLQTKTIEDLYLRYVDAHKTRD